MKGSCRWFTVWSIYGLFTTHDSHWQAGNMVYLTGSTIQVVTDLRLIR